MVRKRVVTDTLVFQTPPELSEFRTQSSPSLLCPARQRMCTSIVAVHWLLVLSASLISPFVKVRLFHTQLLLCSCDFCGVDFLTSLLIVCSPSRDRHGTNIPSA